MTRYLARTIVGEPGGWRRRDVVDWWVRLATKPARLRGPVSCFWEEVLL